MNARSGSLKASPASCGEWVIPGIRSRSAPSSRSRTAQTASEGAAGDSPGLGRRVLPAAADDELRVGRRRELGERDRRLGRQPFTGRCDERTDVPARDRRGARARKAPRLDEAGIAFERICGREGGLDPGDQLAHGGIAGGDRERGRLDHGQRAHALGSGGRREQAADAAVRVADEMRRLHEQGGDVLGVALEVDALDVGARAEPASVEQADAELVGEGRLRGERRCGRREAPVHEQDGLAGAGPGDVEVVGHGPAG